MIPRLLNKIEENILLVTGKDTGRHSFLVKALQNENFNVTVFAIHSEPDTKVISEGAKLAREKKCTAVIGIGGGSALDGAKAIAAYAPNRGKLVDYLEVIGNGKIFENSPLPFIAVPTTAGTGAEVTKNSVILSPEHKVKVSLRSDLMFPRVAVIDPELTLSMTPEITAATGMDALAHLLEAYVSNQSNPFTDSICREGMRRISASLEKAYVDGSNLQAREDMAYAALLGGMALANVKLGAVHGFAGPLGGMHSIRHGLICAALLPAVISINLRAVREQNSRGYIEKYNEVGRLLTGTPEATAPDAIEWVERIVNTMCIPRFSSLGLPPARFQELVNKAKDASSMKGNPVQLSDEDLYEILEIAG